MTEEAFPVKIVFKHGPVTIKSIEGACVRANYDLWDKILASEFFPPNVDSGFYALTLEKPVSLLTEIQPVESELIEALELLATAWPFSGGSFMILEQRNENRTPCYESNAKEVEAGLLAAKKLRHVEKTLQFSHEIVGTYLNPPLAIAARLTRKMRGNLPLSKLLWYHYHAWLEYYSRKRVEHSLWFIHLYKIRDVLTNIYGGERNTESRLNIPKDDWSFFGFLLNNNDLRHAEVRGTPPSITRQDVDRLYHLARSWIGSHLLSEGIL